MKEKIVSIIIPVYNVQKYIDCCIQSVVNQSYKNLEIILVDDASEDLSGSICDTWAEKDKRINVIHKKINEGLSEARNTALNCCSGEYVLFLDGDDAIHKDMISVCISTIEKNDLDFVSYSFEKVNSDFKGVAEYSLKASDLHDIYSGNEIIRQLIINGIFEFSACNKVYRAKLFENVMFPKGLLHEDNYTTPEILLKAKRAGILDQKLYYYRMNPSSITNTKNIKREKDLVAAYEHTLKLVSGNEELYYKVMASYLSGLATLYKVSDKNDRKIILKKYKNTMSFSHKYMKNNWIFAYKLFVISPFLYYNFVNIRSKNILAKLPRLYKYSR